MAHGSPPGCAGDGGPRPAADLAGTTTDHDPDQMAVLHDEIGRLPEKYRLPIVLCCVDAETHDEAARKLGWPVGTVHGRLSRGRDLLRGRLGRLGGVVIPEVISRPAALASKRRREAVPEPLLRSMLAAHRWAIPTKLQSLVKGAVAAMFIEKLKSTGLGRNCCHSPGRGHGRDGSDGFPGAGEEGRGYACDSRVSGTQSGDEAILGALPPTELQRLPQTRLKRKPRRRGSREDACSCRTARTRKRCAFGAASTKRSRNIDQLEDTLHGGLGGLDAVRAEEQKNALRTA